MAGDAASSPLQPGGSRVRATEWCALVLLLLAVHTLSAATQERIAFKQGLGSDGAVYAKVAVALANGERPTGRAPFVYRIGTPALVALAPGADFRDRFLWVNVAGSALAAALLLVWLARAGVGRGVRALLVLAFVTQWLAPVRYTHFYPTWVEPWSFVFLLGGLVLVERAVGRATPGRVAVLAVWVVVGVLFREIVLLVGLAFAASGARSLALRARAPRVVPLLAGLAAVAVVHAFAVPSNDYTFSGQALRFARDNTVWRYAAAWFIAFGPVLALVAWDWRGARRTLAARPHWLVYLLATAALAWLGGSDTERFLLWASPVVYALVGRAIEAHRDLLRSAGLVALLVVAQAVSQRVPWTTPDYPGDFPHRWPLLTPPSAEVPYTDLLAFGDAGVVAAALAQYTLLSVAILAWLWVRRRAAVRAAVRVGG